MKTYKIFLLLPVIFALTACGVVDGDKVDKTIDLGIDSKELTQLKAGIWVDPNGCDHWIIDDGVEGYLSARLDPRGKPVCSGVAPPTIATGPFKSGSEFPDPI
ncbi:MAG: hypothetical protein AAFQ38_16235 [Pseudomonadota bacterium]